MRTFQRSESLVLVVDDQPAARVALGTLLGAEGYQIAYASSGAEGLAQARALHPDLILLDVLMPDVDGFATCRQLRADPLLGEVPVVLVTSLEDREANLEGWRAGADDFLSRPYDPAELRARVRLITQLNWYRQLVARQTEAGGGQPDGQDAWVVLGEDDRLQRAHPRARRWLGLPPDELPAGATFRGVAGQHHRLVPEAGWRDWPALRQRQLPRWLVRPATPITRVLWLAVELPAAEAPGPTGTLVRLHDVTPAVIELQNRVRYHRHVAGPLREPLEGLEDSLRSLARELDGCDNPAVARWLAAGRQHLEHLRSLERQVERLDPAGGACPTGTPVDPALEPPTGAPQLLSGAAWSRPAPSFPLASFPELLAESGRAAGLPAPAVTLPPGLEHHRLPLDRVSLELILYAVLEHARERHPGAAPGLRLRLAATEPARLLLEVQSAGPAFTATELEQAWLGGAPFARDPDPAPRGSAGVRAAAATLVWGAGGRLLLRNRPGSRGTRVRLELPCPRSPGARLPAGPPPLVAGFARDINRDVD
jgi:CheY-like chemotaxis protein